MNKSYKKRSKTLLLLSTTSILSAFISAPIIGLAESNNTDIVTEEIKKTDIITYTFLQKFSEEELKTELFDMTNQELTIKGATFENSTIRVSLSDSKSEASISQADDKGHFEFNVPVVNAGDELTLEVLNQEKKLLETAVFSVKQVEVIEETIIPDKTTENESDTDENQEEETEALRESLAQDEQSVETEAPSAIAKAVKLDLAAAAQDEPVGTKYYYIQSGDTLYSIAQKFKKQGVTVEKLMIWNQIMDATTVKAGNVLGINGMNNYESYNQVDRTFSSSREFLDFAGTYAKEVAAEHGLYASVMMAQTALETGYGKSGLSTIANNFFGIKAGSGYKGYTIVMPTWEIVNGARVSVDAEFRFYPSYAESFADNADKLRRGLTSNSNFYNGAWVENTNTFKDATLFLNQRYATDTAYHTKLNNIILSNNLTRFDSKSYIDPAFNAIMMADSYNISNLPMDHRNAHGNVKTIASAKDYLGAYLTVSQVTVNGKYANIGLNGREIGWVHVDALLQVNQSIKNVAFNAYVSAKSTPIYSLPLGEKDNSVVAKAEDYMNETVYVTAQTENGNQSFITKDGEAIGWILTRDLTNTTRPRIVVINSADYSVDTLPWERGGEHQKIASTAEYRGQELQVIAISNNGAYSLVNRQGQTLGWIDNRALTDFTYREMNKADYITANNYSIDSLPYGTPGFKSIGKTNNLLGQKVQVTKETSNGAYFFVRSEGKDIGWIDKRAFGLQGEPYETLITYENFSIDTLPWGTPGFKNVASSKDYLNQKVQVAGTSKNGAYLLIRQNGKDIGWVDHKAVLSDNANVVTPYQEYIGSTGYTIDSLPWGTPGFRKVGSTSDVLGQRVTIMAESNNKAYALISVNNKNLGWVDKNAFGLSQSFSSAVVVDGIYNVDTLPWGTPGFENIGRTANYINETVEVVGTVQNGAYALIRQGETDIGWVDQRALSTVESVPVTEYSIYIGGSGYSIDTLPWGTRGFKKVSDSTQIHGKIVTVTKESKNRAYAFISVDGKQLGWIDKKAFGLKQDQNSAIVLQGQYNVDSLPWGTPGFKKIGLTADYTGDLVRIVGSTHNGAYTLINKDNKNIGWVDTRSLKKLTTTSKSYTSQIKFSNYSIDNLPWGTPGFKKVGTSSDYLNQKVTVIAESSNKSYVFIRINGQDIGWIDKKALA